MSAVTVLIKIAVISGCAPFENQLPKQTMPRRSCLWPEDWHARLGYPYPRQKPPPRQKARQRGEVQHNLAPIGLDGVSLGQLTLLGDRHPRQNAQPDQVSE